MPRAKKAAAVDDALPADIDRLLKLKEDASLLYKQAGELEDQLVRRMSVAGAKILALPSGLTVSLVNNFATKNVFWKSTPVKAREIKVVT